MVNISIFLGTGDIGGDIPYKEPWIIHLKTLHNVHIISTLSEKIHFNDDLKNYIGVERYENLHNKFLDLKKSNISFEYLYEDPQFFQKPSHKEILDIQEWLGVSLKYMTNLSRIFCCTNNLIDTRDQDLLNIFTYGLIIVLRRHFEKNEIDVYINTIEDTTASIVAYYVAKRLNVRVLGFVPGRFPKPGIMFCEDFFNLCQFTAENEKNNEIIWNSIHSLYNHKTINNSTLLNLNKERFALRNIIYRFIELNHIRKYTKFRASLQSIDPSVECMKPKHSIIKDIYGFLRTFFRVRVVPIFYTFPNYNENFLFFPLHAINDAQITFREPFLDQLNLIKAISKSLPLNYYLYVKTHPHAVGSDFSIKELHELSKLTNIRIIPPNWSPLELIVHSKAVVTINSTVGFEALIQGIPVISLGHDFYVHPEFAYIVRDMNDLPMVILNAIYDGYKHHNAKDIKSFITSVYENTIWINQKIDKFGIWEITEQEGKKISIAIDQIVNGWYPKH